MEIPSNEPAWGFRDLEDLVNNLRSPEFEKRVPPEVLQRAGEVSARVERGGKFPTDLAEKLASFTD